MMVVEGGLLPIVDLDIYRDGCGEDRLRECSKTAEALHRFGALLVKDSRVREEDNGAFLDLLEDYFDQDEALLVKDMHPECGYQVGVTLENTEKPACKTRPACQALIEALEAEHRPLDMEQHSTDPKARFFHRMSIDPPKTAFPRLAYPKVVPEAFKDVWLERLDRWGTQLKTAVEAVAEMTARGLGQEKDYLTGRAKYGPHLLAPTASDLRKWGKEGTILAGFHTDISCLTIHGASRYPGLNIWARNTGQRIAVRIPRGHLLVQAGMQLEHLTAGYVLAGYHEVVVNAATMAALAQYQERSHARPPIRISSTFFWHLDSDCLLEPMERFKRGSEEEESKYPAILAGRKVEAELGLIDLMAA